MTRFNPDDPKWTAYILGELDGTDLEAVEEELKSSKEARSLVEELRFAAELTKSELRDQAAALTSLTFEQRRTIRAAAGVGRPRRWFGRPVAWATSLAAVGIAIAVAAVSSIFLHQRHVTPATPIESTISENQILKLDSDRQSEPPSLPETKTAKPSAPPATDGSQVLAPVAAAAAAPMAPAPPPAAARAREVSKEAVMPSPPLDEFRAGAGIADQKAQALVPTDKSPIVATTLAGRALVATAPTAGRIFGKISDASAALIPGVAVDATNVLTGSVAKAVTNEAGAYTLDSLQAGTYQVKAELPGFQTIVSSTVQVNAGSPVERDLTMQVAAAAQSAEVSLAADTISVSKVLSALGGAAGKDTTRLQSLTVAPSASSIAPAIPTAGAFGGVLRDSSVGNAASENAFFEADQNPISSLSVDLNTGAYGNVRRYLNQNLLPPRDAVRIEAMVNSFSYDYPWPTGNNPFGASIETAAAPWNPQHRLVRIGIKAKNIIDARLQPARNIVANGVMLEVEFNPAVVGEYRLIDDRSFVQRIQVTGSNENGAISVEGGQTVTALYEIVPRVLKSASTPILTVKIRYKPADKGDVKLLEFPSADRGQTFERASTDFRFAAAVASFGMVLSDSQYKGTASFDSTLAIAKHSLGSDRNGQRHEFVQLVERARQLGAKRQ